VSGPAPEALRRGPTWQALTVVAAFPEVHQAYAAIAALRAAGVHAEVRDDAYVGLAWHHAQALGGIRILVPPTELQAAQEVLAGVEPAVVEAAAAASSPMEQCCPYCRSARVERITGSGFHDIRTWLLLGLPLLLGRIRWKCADCGVEYSP